MGSIGGYVFTTVVLLLSISSSLDPPEFNPGHGHQIVADIQEEDSKE